MNNSNFKIILLCVFVAINTSSLYGQQKYTLETMPRVDVHTHFGNMEEIRAMMKVSETLKNDYGVNLDAWVNLQPFQPVRIPKPLTVDFLEKVTEESGGQILSCIGDYDVTNGLQYSPKELIEWKKRGVVGYKIWAPVVVGDIPPEKDLYTIYEPNYAGIDQAENDSTFITMAEIGLVGSSIHIAQAHPRRWKNPVHFWTAINAWERVLDKHPDVVFVMAHMFNLFYTNEQLDYLKYILATYPNVYLDLGGRIAVPSIDWNKQRNFIIKYADRILYGTDAGSRLDEESDKETAERYMRTFKALDTDEIQYQGFAGKKKSVGYKGLKLPLDVLEKIYFKNALKIYPQLKEVLKDRL